MARGKKAKTEEGQLKGDGSVKKKGRKKAEVAVIVDAALWSKEMNDGFGRLLNFRNRKKALKAEHLDPVTKEETKTRKMLCAVLGTEWEDLKPHFQIFARSNDADDMEPEDRERIHENLSRAFEALSTGGQLDWLDAIGDRPANDGGDDDEAALDTDRMTLEQAEELGFKAQQAGKTGADIPAEVAARPALAKAWNRGWDAGTETAVGKMTGKTTAAAAVH